MVDVLDERLLGRDEYFLTIRALNDEEGVHGALVYIDQFAQMAMGGIFSIEADEILPLWKIIAFFGCKIKCFLA